MIWHVLPNNDIDVHEESSTCKCNPKVEIMDNGDTLILHDAFDGRLGIEWANEVLEQ